MAESRTKPVWKWLGAGAAMVVAGAAAWYARERLIEKPRYRLIEEDRDIEIRDYPALLVAETVTSGDREAALGAGFRRLAAYIAGGGDGGSGTTIAMTAPVLSDPVPAAGGWRTRFLMPRRSTRTTLPIPPAGISIVEIPARRVAAIRFAGWADDAMLDARQDALRQWLADRAIPSTGGAEHGFYNSPAIPGPLRHNEVLIPIG